MALKEQTELDYKPVGGVEERERSGASGWGFSAEEGSTVFSWVLDCGPDSVEHQDCCAG